MQLVSDGVVSRVILQGITHTSASVIMSVKDTYYYYVLDEIISHRTSLWLSVNLSAFLSWMRLDRLAERRRPPVPELPSELREQPRVHL